MTRILRSVILLPLLGFLVGAAFAGEGTTPEEKAAKLEKQARDLAATVEKVRGLEFKKEVKIGVKTEAQLLEFLEKSIDEELPPGKIEAIQRAYAKMGLLPPDLELKKTFLDVMKSQVGGFYNPKTKKLFLIDRRGKKKKNPQMAMMDFVLKRFGMSMDDLVTAHELTHALQDQHFDLEKMDKLAEGNDDRILAMKCVIEGDASLAMYEPLFEKLPFARGMMNMQNLDSTAVPMGPEMKNVPDILKIPLTFPYVAGAKFVGRAKDEGGWKAVDELIKNLPLSTEQVLHPEKYFDRRDDPVFIAFDDDALAPRGWKLLEANTFGELGVQIFLDELLRKKTAVAAAEGWDGDRFAAYGKGEDVFFFWFTTWDSEKEAREFARAYVQRFRKRYGLEAQEDWDREETGVFFFTKGKDHGRLEVRGKDVVVVEGLDAGETEGLVGRLFREVKKRAPGEAVTIQLEDWVDEPARTRGDGFSVTPPKGWSAEREGGFSRVVMRPSRGRGRIEIGVLPLSKPTSPKGLADALVSTIRRKYEGFGKFESEGAEFKGREACRVRYEGVDPGGDRRARYAMHVVIKGSKAYILTVISPPRSLRKIEKAGDEVLESFEFE
ncbi:MAG: hypothetical protein ACYS47_01240 [Planctomycetota bacterium]|jgi:hypothetical protein